jgi:Ser/Thr protein kinase RdoA (MazF antagonist)
MDMHALITFINVRHNMRFTLHEKYATGENQGAYALTDDRGVGYVLKWNERPPWLRSLRRAEQITNHLAERGVPVPKYVLADTRADNVTYWIQTALPGRPPEELRVTHVEQLLDLVERQARQTLLTGSNWSEYVRAVVFAGHSGWQDSLAQYNDETYAVLARLKQLLSGKEQVMIRADDICHGDMGTDNVLVDGHTVSGIVDWDAAGEGDRALDLSKLLFYSYHISQTRELLRKRIVEISGQNVYAIYLTYNILAQLDWSIHHHSADAVVEGVLSSHQILTDLEASL